MKKYKEYMDSIEVPDTLHQRLLALEPPAKRPVWVKYGTVAAALVLVCGLGGFSLWAAGVNHQTAPIPFYPDSYQGVAPESGGASTEPDTPGADPGELAPEFEPNADIAPIEPGDVTEPGMKTIGGYDVPCGSGPGAMVSHYLLPYIEYGIPEEQFEMCLDWDVPMGAVKKDLARDEIVALMGGADVVADHLDWDEYQLSGWAAWYEDGSFWGAFIYGTLIYYGGPSNQFEFAVTAGALPPTCVAYPDSVTQEILGLTVTADGYELELDGLSYLPHTIHQRRVSFLKGGYGYRFEMSSADPGTAEKLVSRLVRRLADSELDLAALTQDGANGSGAEPQAWVDERTGFHDADTNCPYCADGSAHTHSYDPGEDAGLLYSAPVVEVCELPLSAEPYSVGEPNWID